MLIVNVTDQIKTKLSCTSANKLAPTLFGVMGEHPLPYFYAVTGSVGTSQSRSLAFWLTFRQCTLLVREITMNGCSAKQISAREDKQGKKESPMSVLL